jgi:integrase
LVNNNLVQESIVKLHEDIRSQSKVTTFLRSIRRNSNKTSINYETSLSYLQLFLIPQGHTSETILNPLAKNEINVYTLLEQFIAYLTDKKSLSSNTVRQYLVGIKSYFAYYDIDVIPSKFKRKVKLPKRLQEDQEPIDAEDIRNILLNCNNRRLKTFILVLASGAMRSTEALAIRIRDIDFKSNPTKIHLRKEYTKTRVARDVYISAEATKYLNDWISWKYRYRKYLKPEEQHIKSDDDLVFQVAKSITRLQSLYVKLLKEFGKVLTLSGLYDKKEGMNRRTISFHSLRRHAKTVISTQVNQDYSEWFLGHSDRSSYWAMKEAERKEIYLDRIMKYLTFLDYTTLKNSSRSIEAKLEEKEKEIMLLRKRDTDSADKITRLEENMNTLLQTLVSKGVLEPTKKKELT